MYTVRSSAMGPCQPLEHGRDFEFQSQIIDMFLESVFICKNCELFISNLNIPRISNEIRLQTQNVSFKSYIQLREFLPVS